MTRWVKTPIALGLLYLLWNYYPASWPPLPWYGWPVFLTVAGIGLYLTWVAPLGKQGR